MSRIKRWLLRHEKKVNPDGSLKQSHINELVSYGLNETAIARYAGVFQNEYNELLALDQTAPEPEEKAYTAWDFWSEEDKQRFNRDGTLKLEYIAAAKAKGLSTGCLERLEFEKMLEVETFNRVSSDWARRGMNFGAWKMEDQKSAAGDAAGIQKRMRQDIRNGEPLDALPEDIDPDDYYQAQRF